MNPFWWLEMRVANAQAHQALVNAQGMWAMTTRPVPPTFAEFTGRCPKPRLTLIDGGKK